MSLLPTSSLGSLVSPESTGSPTQAPRRATPIVYVIDDDAMMGNLLTITMESAGYEVHTFTDGRDAHAKAIILPPDLALVDLTMPALSGAETIARLRSLQPALPVVVISGVTEEEALAAAPTANAYLKKPFPFSTLPTTAAAVRPQL